MFALSGGTVAPYPAAHGSGIISVVPRFEPDRVDSPARREHGQSFRQHGSRWQRGNVLTEGDDVRSIKGVYLRRVGGNQCPKTGNRGNNRQAPGFELHRSESRRPGLARLRQESGPSFSGQLSDSALGLIPIPIVRGPFSNTRLSGMQHISVPGRRRYLLRRPPKVIPYLLYGAEFVWRCHLAQWYRYSHRSILRIRGHIIPQPPVAQVAFFSCFRDIFPAV